MYSAKIFVSKAANLTLCTFWSGPAYSKAFVKHIVFTKHFFFEERPWPCVFFETPVSDQTGFLEWTVCFFVKPSRSREPMKPSARHVPEWEGKGPTGTDGT